MTRDQAMAELLTMDRELEELQSKLPASSRTVSSLEEVLPVVIAIAKCEFRLDQLQTLLALPSEFGQSTARRVDEDDLL
jgi:hypothetical protein